MGIQEFQNFIEGDTELNKNGVKSVDLVKTAWKLNKSQGQVGGMPPNRLPLVVDAESCLDRLYGGFYSDWCCGGEWNHMLEFLSVFFSTLQQANVHMAIFVNGALEPARFDDWITEQMKARQNVRNILKHLNKRGTPPPKVWWVPPTGVRSVLRLALRHLNVTVMSSMESHHQEVVGFLRENGYHGIVADNSEYCIFDPPRYFSAKSLKLTLKMTVETREIVMDEVARTLDLNPNRFSLLAGLLGNHMLTTAELASFHSTLIPDLDADKDGRTVRITKAVVDYVRSLQTVDDVVSLGAEIFGSSEDPRVRKLKDVVEYYNSGTEEGYRKFIPSRRKKREGIKLASDEQEGESRQAYKSLMNEKKKYKVVGEPSEDKATEDATDKLDNLTIQEKNEEGKVSHVVAEPSDAKIYDDNKPTVKPEGGYPRAKNTLRPTIPSPHPEVLKTASDRHRQACMSPALYSLLTTGDLKLPQLLEDESHSELPPIHSVYRELRQRVYGIVFNQHHLSFTKNKFEDEVNSIKKSIKALKTAQKKVGAGGVTLLNGEPRNELEALEEKVDAASKRLDNIEKNAPDLMDIKIREWVPYNCYASPEMVSPKTCQWSVPTVKRLWFGTTIEDKQRRLRAFLSCLNSDIPLMMNTGNVPQHLLLMCCVLRYIMTQKNILRKPELDAFLVTACSSDLMDAENLSRIKLDLVTARGVQLSTLFMQGVEMALLANDACGAPVPFLMCAPWLFFDGKLFHSKLRRVVVAQNLLEMCNHDIQMVVKVEQMRKAILDGLVPEFSNIPFPGMIPPAGVGHAGVGPAGPQFPPGKQNYNMIQQNKMNMMMNNLNLSGAGYHPHVGALGRGAAGPNMMGGSSGLPYHHQQPPAGYMARGGNGGKLVVAGSVVGQWGSNNASNHYKNGGGVGGGGQGYGHGSKGDMMRGGPNGGPGGKRW